MKYLIVGSGYRSEFFIRSHQKDPKHTLVGVLTRNQEKADMLKEKYGVETFTEETKALSTKPDLIVVCVNNTDIHEKSMYYLRLGYRVLQETPAGLTIDQLKECYTLGQDNRLFIAEQYIFCETHKARLEALKTHNTGNAHTLFISEAHDYHGASLIRAYLSEGLSDFSIRAMSYKNPIVNTDSRTGPVYTGELKNEERVHMILTYADGKRAFYDFSGIQYHSFIRERTMRLLCERAELNNSTLSYLDDDNHPQTLNVHPLEDQNAEDEAAIALIIDNIADVIDGGEVLYPLAYALEDAYTMILMNDAINYPFTEFKRQPMPWH